MASAVDSNLQIIEALIFASPEPISENRISGILGDLLSANIPEVVEALNTQYQSSGRSFRIVRGGGGYRFVTMPEFGQWVRSLVVGSRRLRLSRAALETISIIAYRQPISRQQIESIRGVEVGGIIRMLLERKLIEIRGRAQSPRRPLIFGTTNEFLQHFGIDSLDDLPTPGELKEAVHTEDIEDNYRSE